jgi:hypothetical protein
MLRYRCEKLPDDCYHVVRGRKRGENVAVIRPGIAGVDITSIDLGDGEQAALVVRALNHARGISEIVEAAMVNGATHGWESASADPDWVARNDVRFMWDGAGDVSHAAAEAEAWCFERIGVVH